MTKLTIDNINPNVVNAKYAVRGELALRSEGYRSRLQHEGHGLPFGSIISANIGNPQQLGQKPLTFFRQVLSLLENPELLQHEKVLIDLLGYPVDVIARARSQLAQVQSVGAYSASAGIPAFKESIAEFLDRRDGFPADPKHIFLSGGASSAVNTILHIICADEASGVMIPIPQYPLYTALLSVVGAKGVPYLLDEERNWGTSIVEIKSAYEQAKSQGVDVRAIVVINPGNPTGASLTEVEIREILKFARDRDLVVLADEVYQANVFHGAFHSCRKVLLGLQQEESFEVELASVHSISKGMVGECGHRGGYFELIGFDPLVEEQIYKFVSITLCAPVIGQCLVELMVNPPRPGAPSYPLYSREYAEIEENLKERAYKLYEAFKELEGFQCCEPQGSMYLFPTIRLPQRAIHAAEQYGKSVDEYYCSTMLDDTGICIVPGKGFGQAQGSAHFRITFLAPGTDWISRIVTFHKSFMERYR